MPTTIFGGYYDHHFEGTIEGWNLLSDETKAKTTWCWAPGTTASATPLAGRGGDNYAYDVNTDTFTLVLQHHGQRQGAATGVDAYVVGDDEWVHLDSLPLEATGN